MFGKDLPAWDVLSCPGEQNISRAYSSIFSNTGLIMPEAAREVLAADPRHNASISPLEK